MRHFSGPARCPEGGWAGSEGSPRQRAELTSGLIDDKAFEESSKPMVAHLLLNPSACLFDQSECDLSFSLEAKVLLSRTFVNSLALRIEHESSH